MPAVIAHWYRETSVPLSCLGATSDKYSGTMKFTMPTAKPTKILDRINI